MTYPTNGLPATLRPTPEVTPFLTATAVGLESHSPSYFQIDPHNPREATYEFAVVNSIGRHALAALEETVVTHAFQPTVYSRELRGPSIRYPDIHAVPLPKEIFEGMPLTITEISGVIAALQGGRLQAVRLWLRTGVSYSTLSYVLEHTVTYWGNPTGPRMILGDVPDTGHTIRRHIKRPDPATTAAWREMGQLQRRVGRTNPRGGTVPARTAGRYRAH
jgi:hypothetical protein